MCLFEPIRTVLRTLGERPLASSCDSESVELGDNASVPQAVLDQVNALLVKAKAGWKLG